MNETTKDLSSTAPSAPVPAATALNRDEAAVRAVIDRMMTAFAAGDVPGIMATYRPDAVVVGNPGVPVVGSASLAEMFEGFVAAGFPFTTGAHEVIMTDATALHLMDWRGAGPDGVPFRALSAAVLTRDESGDWRMVIDHPFADGVMHRP
jgi:uncharacterized protein (TIGR02246 family)